MIRIGTASISDQLSKLVNIGSLKSDEQLTESLAKRMETIKSKKLNGASQLQTKRLDLFNSPLFQTISTETQQRMM